MRMYFPPILTCLIAIPAAVAAKPPAASEQLKAAEGTDWLGQIFSLYMAPLWLCSFLLVALIVERAFALRAPRILDPKMTDEVSELLAARQASDALERAAKSDTVIGRAWAQGLKDFSAGGVPLKEALTDATLLALKPLKRNLQGVTTIGVITPLLGLLGTIVGMIMTFDQIAATGGADKAALAKGISLALFTTAGGMVLAIPAIVCGRFFNARLLGYAEEAEAAIHRAAYRHMHAVAPAPAPISGKPDGGHDTKPSASATS